MNGKPRPCLKKNGRVTARKFVLHWDLIGRINVAV